MDKKKNGELLLCFFSLATLFLFSSLLLQTPPFFSLALFNMALTEAEIVSLPIHSFYSTHFLNSHLNPSISEKSPQLLYKTTFFLFLFLSHLQSFLLLQAFTSSTAPYSAKKVSLNHHRGKMVMSFSHVPCSSEHLWRSSSTHPNEKKKTQILLV